MKTREAVVAGATGLVGSSLLELLLERPEYERVHIVGRRPQPSTDRKLVAHVMDFEKLRNWMPEVGPQSDWYCCLGTTKARAGSAEAFRRVDFTYVVQFGEAAVRAEARQVLAVSSMGANANSRLLYTRTKGEAELALAGLPLLGVHQFRPSLLLGDRKEFRLGEWLGSAVSNVVSPLLVGRWAAYRPILAGDVAKAMVYQALNFTPLHEEHQSDRVQAMARLYDEVLSSTVNHRG